MRKTGLAVFCLIAMARTAGADSRDDALSAMLRCTGIAELQARLACYDAAVARVRGALLAPAPAPAYQPVPQHVFTPAPGVSVPPPAPPPRPRRKDSVDRFMDSIFGSGGPARPPQTSTQQFGSESIAYKGERAYPSHQDGDTVDAISGRLVSYRFLGNARLVVSLDNGQEWMESGGDSLTGYLAHPALYYSAQIVRASGGSYAMTLTGITHSIQVRRLR